MQVLSAQNQLSIFPKYSLVSNIGFGQGATHTTNRKVPSYYHTNKEIEFPLQHPPYIVPFITFEKAFYQQNNSMFYTLMRYIRIFSDLSNQIRFATQKRVLVEIALIKLCRPAMETNLDSVLDRIRVLEQKIEERPVQQVVVQSAAAPGSEATAAQAEPPKPPQKAAPEDLQKIVASWKMIVGQTTAAFKQALLQSVPKYNGETGEPILYVEFQTPLGRLYPDDSDAKKELQTIIEQKLGKSIELHMLVAEDHQQTNLTQITVDQAIRENIHMDVVIEETPGSEPEE